MKKLNAAALLAVLLAAACFVTCCVYWICTKETNIRQAEYDAGFDDGIQWAIENMEIYVGDQYAPEDTDGTARADGHEQTIYIDLGGLTYEHRITQF